MLQEKHHQRRMRQEKEYRLKIKGVEDFRSYGKNVLAEFEKRAAAQGIQNGVIELGKTLTNAQKTKIFQLTGDSEAWFTVQESGYTISVEIRQDGSEYKAYYKLIYSKGDAICYVEGSDILI